MERNAEPETTIWCAGSPCNNCVKNWKGRSCTTVLEGKAALGCIRWNYWARRGWASIHAQGMETIRAAREKGERW
jgi:hypothetical protein